MFDLKKIFCRKNLKKLILIGLALLGLFILVLYNAFKSEPISYMTVTAQVRDISKKVYATGTIEGIPRDEIKLFIEYNGGTVTGSVSKNTDAVIVGTDPGSKYDKALTLNIKIINEEEIKQIMGK